MVRINLGFITNDAYDRPEGTDAQVWRQTQRFDVMFQVVDLFVGRVGAENNNQSVDALNSFEYGFFDAIAKLGSDS